VSTFAPVSPTTRTGESGCSEEWHRAMNSTRNLSQLPDVEGLRKLLQSLAMLDAIVCREWQYR